MISVIVPTRNRARTLQCVAPALDGGYEILLLARVALALLDRRARLGTWSAR